MPTLKVIDDYKKANMVKVGLFREKTMSQSAYISANTIKKGYRIIVK